MSLELFCVRSVFTLRRRYNQDVWLKIGKAVTDNDGTTRLLLDVVPLDGKIVIADAPPKLTHQSEEVHAS